MVLSWRSLQLRAVERGSVIQQSRRTNTLRKCAKWEEWEPTAMESGLTGIVRDAFLL